MKVSTHSVHFAVVALVCVLSDLLLPGRVGLAASAALFLCWSLHLVNRERRSALLKLNPIVCYQAWQAATLGVTPLYLALSPAAAAGVEFGNYILPLEIISYGHAVMIAGSWTFYMALKTFQPKKAARQPFATYEIRPAVLIAAAVTGIGFHLTRETVTIYAGSTVAQLGVLFPAVLCLIAVNPSLVRQHSRKTHAAVLLLGSLLLLLLNAQGDSKMELMFSFVPIIWWLLLRNGRSALVVTGVGFALIYLGIILPLVTFMRDEMRESTRRSLWNSEMISRSTDSMKYEFSTHPIEYLGSSVEDTLYRMCDPCAAAMVVTIAHEWGFQYGRGLQYVPMTFIPRALWRDKPILDPGREFTTVLGWAKDPSLASTSTGQTSAGELYWNFGWPGVLLGMYLCGAAVSALWWRAAGSDPRRGVLEMAAYTGAMLSFVLATGSVAGGSIVGAISAGLFWRAVIIVRGWILEARSALSRR